MKSSIALSRGAGLVAAFVLLCASASAAAPQPAAPDTHPAATPVARTVSVKLIAFAAANTTDPLNDLIAAFEASHPGVTVVPEYAGTQVLAAQAEQGAPFDLFISADRAHIDALNGDQLVGAVAPLSAGHEVIVVPKDDPAGIASLRDLADKPVKLVLGVDTVPIGIYTRQVLAKASADYGADFSARVLGHAVSLETNVKQVLEKVALGEADAGIVYFTDVTAAYKAKVTIVQIPSQYLVVAQNFIAVGACSKYPGLARELVATALGPTGQAIFRRYGYDPMP